MFKSTLEDLGLPSINDWERGIEAIEQVHFDEYLRFPHRIEGRHILTEQPSDEEIENLVKEMMERGKYIDIVDTRNNVF